MNVFARSQKLNSDAELDLRDLLAVLLRYKWVILSIIFGAFVITLILVLRLPNIYYSEALLAPYGRGSASELSALRNQYRGLASIAGINLSPSPIDKTALGIEVLKSRKFITNFIQRHEILVPLMASRGWNPETGDLVIDEKVYDVASQRWTRKVKPPKSPKPSMQEAYEKFTDSLTVTQSKQNGFITVGLEHVSAEIAKQWVDWLVADLNSSVMQQDVSEAEQAIKYLRNQIESTSLADLQSVFFSLIEEQTKTVMLAAVSEEYLFKTLDPAFVPMEKSKPNRALLLFLGTLGGVIISILTAGFLSGARN